MDTQPAFLPPSVATPTASSQNPDEVYLELEKTVLELKQIDNPEPLRKAYAFAKERHAGQTRASGEPYILHPLGVAQILAEMRMDLICLQTGLLHDVLEDTGTTLQEIQELFGPEVARCVDGVTKLTKLQLHSAAERQAESLRKMFLAMVEDIRVIIVKLADRLHNLRTLDPLPEDKRKRIALETLEIYAPIAHRLGMGRIRAELEDLGFRYYDPEAYRAVVSAIEKRRSASEDYLKQIIRRIEEILAREGIPGRVEGRVKRPYSVYQKLRRQRITIEQVYDLLGVRVITDSVRNCYAVLGLIHNEWSPVPGRLKDFIAIPRPNRYQSLHTSVIGPGGQTFEVQIRTEEMHRIAEEGIAAHWKYKEGTVVTEKDEKWIAWLRQLVEWLQETRDPGEFITTLKDDLTPEEVYVFTPKGKLIVLPKGATPIDFAYAVHTEVGHSCVGAKVNGRIVPLSYVLRNGDVVEILTQAGHRPSKDWLKIVKTSRARNKIKQIINAEARARAIELGQKFLEKEAKHFDLNLSSIDENTLLEAARDHGCAKLEDLYAAIGFGKISPRTVLKKLLPPSQQESTLATLTRRLKRLSRRRVDSEFGVRVEGVDGLLVYRAGCCRPIPGDEIVGFVTRGRGVAVHSVQCPNVRRMVYEPDRKVQVQWESQLPDESYAVRIVIYTEDRPGILNQFTSILSAENCNIRALEARSVRPGEDVATVDMTVDIRDRAQLERILAAIKQVRGVRDVVRA